MTASISLTVSFVPSYDCINHGSNEAAPRDRRSGPCCLSFHRDKHHEAVLPTRERLQQEAEARQYKRLERTDTGVAIWGQCGLRNAENGRVVHCQAPEEVARHDTVP